MNNTEVREHCARIFALLDTNGRGKIPRDQFARALRLLNWNPTDEEVQEMLEKHVSKEVTYDQFVSIISSSVPPRTVAERKADMREAFMLFDEDNTGFIDKNVFVTILTKCGQGRLDKREVMAWVNKMDRRKDGKIRIAELEELFVTDEDVSDQELEELFVTDEDVSDQGNDQWDMV